MSSMQATAEGIGGGEGWTAATPADRRQHCERRHFDRHYAAERAQGVAALSDFDRRRYAAPPATTIYPREYYFHLLGLRPGMTALEIACGNGIDATIAASNGADVFAYDLSPEATELTRRRADLSGVGDRVRTEVCGSIDEAFAGRRFDRVMGYAALHHLAPEGLAAKVASRLKPGGAAVFAEPVVNSRALARLRACVPVAVSDVTEDERPLCDADIAALADPSAGLGRLERREFQFFSRVWPLLPAGCWSLTVGLHRVDAWLMRIPALRRFASVSVFRLMRG
jgi:2-polyprenyl-3-methyl-5-hydroxy-6-metoxy-1,4-benzoquinol methylase